MNSHLKSVSRPEQWRDYHDLRRIVLFESRGRYGVYDDTHPDEHAPGNYPMLLYQGDVAVGAIRIDLLPDHETGIFRRVAIQKDWQRQGLGRTLMEQAEAFALSHGCPIFVANVARDAIGFYLKLGYQFDEGSDALNQENPRMTKVANVVNQ